MMNSILRWARVIVFSVALTALISLIAGMLYERLANARDARRFPRIGTLYQVDGETLNLHCIGQGSPAVILEAGLGSPAYSWFKVQPEISRWTRVCSYDRAGYGWSAPARGPRDARTIAQQLHALLAAGDVKPPYVFVGHSFGGFIARVFNGMYPAEIESAVLVDSSHPDQERYMPPALVREDARMLAKFRFVPPAINIGLVRLMRKFGALDVVPRGATGRDRDILEYLIFQPKFFRAALAEMALMNSVSADQTRAAGGFGDKPLVVITAGRREMENDYGFLKVWTGKLQPDLLNLSSNRRQVFLADSTHLVPYDRPDAIVSAVHDLLASH